MLFDDEPTPNVNPGEDQCSKSGARGPHHHPAGQPGPADGFRTRPWQFVGRRQRRRDDAAAMRTNGEMGKRLLLLMHRQRVFDERAELIRVWMLPGLEKVAHIFSDAPIGFEAVLSENGGLCEVCSTARRFNSISRGSAPRASSAARLLSPP